MADISREALKNAISLVTRLRKDRESLVVAGEVLETLSAAIPLLDQFAEKKGRIEKEIEGLVAALQNEQGNLSAAKEATAKAKAEASAEIAKVRADAAAEVKAFREQVDAEKKKIAEPLEKLKSELATVSADLVREKAELAGVREKLGIVRTAAK